MSNPISNFYKTDICNSNNLFENSANLCFSPVREIFGGRKVYKVDNAFLETVHVEKKNIVIKIIMVARAILFLIPGVVVGTALKTIALIFPSVRKSNSAYRKFRNTQQANTLMISDRKKEIHFYGDRASFDPSSEALKSGFPWNFIEKQIRGAPIKMKMQHFKPCYVVRAFNMALDFSKLKDIDISETYLAKEQLQEIQNKMHGKMPKSYTIYF